MIPISKDRHWWKLFLTFTLVAMAGCFRLLFLGSLGISSPYLTFYPAVAIAAVVGGLFPGILAAILSALFADYFWLEPIGTFGILHAIDWVAMSTFLGSSTIISITSEIMHRATRKAKIAEAHALLAAEREKTALAIQENMEKYRMLFENMLNGFAYCEMIYNEDKPQDFIYLAVNPAFELLTGLKDVVGRKVTEVIPGISEAYPGLLETYGRVSLGGEPERIEICIKDLGIWLDISVYSTNRGYFTAIFENITDRREMISEIERGKREWEKTFNSVPDLIAIIDPEFRIIRVNKAMAQRLGKPPEDCIGLVCHEYLHELPHPVDYCPHLRTLQDGMEHVTEASFLDSDWLISTSPLFDEDGKLIGAVHVARDITDRKRIENQLRLAHDEMEKRVRERTADLLAANAKLREQAALIDLSPDAILTKDSDGRISFWSRGAEETYGFKEAEAIGKQTSELLGTRSSLPIERINKEVLSKGKWRGELIQTTSTGDEIVVESRWRLKPGKNKEIAGLLEINRDITEKKKTGEMLRRSNRALKALSQCNEALVRETGETELFKRVCNTIVEVGGYLMAWVGIAENDEIKSIRPISFAGYEEGFLSQSSVTWADDERGLGPVATSIRIGAVQVSKDLIKNPLFKPWRKAALARGYASCISLPLIIEGQVFGALAIYAPEPDAFDDEEVLFLTSLAENLSHGIGSIRTAVRKRETEEAMRSYMEKLKRTNSELEEFAFIASHDLQEPLRKIQTFGSLLRSISSGRLDPAALGHLTKMEKAADRMRVLIDDLLKYSRVAGKPEVFREVDLAGVISGLIQEFAGTLKRLRGTIDLGNLPVVHAEPTRMYQLFQNLIANALKFQSKGSKPKIRIYSEDEGNVCRIHVEDNGIGFDESYLPVIFKPYERLKGREYDGTGMGLAICRKIVEQHGGTITAKSKPGKGATFIITLPLEHPLLDKAA